MSEFWLWKGDQEDWEHCVCYEYEKNQKTFPSALTTFGNKFNELREGDSGTYRVQDVQRDIRGTWEIVQPIPSLQEALEKAKERQKVTFERVGGSGLIDHYTMRVENVRPAQPEEEHELLHDVTVPARMRITFRNGFLACIRTYFSEEERLAE